MPEPTIHTCAECFLCDTESAYAEQLRDVFGDRAAACWFGHDHAAEIPIYNLVDGTAGYCLGYGPGVVVQ